MTAILYLKSSPRGAASQSSRLGDVLIARLRSRYPQATVITRDLAAERIPHIDSEYVGGRYLPAEKRTPAQVQALRPSESLIAEVKAANILVIASAMINFSISSTLKAWIDQIIRAGQTYGMQDGRPVGLLTGKKVYVVEARGGSYAEPPLSHMDFQRPYLRAVLGFLGMTDITFITADALMMGDAAASRSVAAAEQQISALAD